MSNDLAHATVNGAPFHFRAGSAADRGVIQQVFERRDYDIGAHGRQSLRLQNWLGQQLLPPLIVDVGANIGAATVWFRSQLRWAVVVAIEPEARNYDILIRNCDRFSDVTCVLGALASSSGRGVVLDPGRGEWGYQVAAVPAQSPTDESVGEIRLYEMAELLDAGHARNTIPYIVKIDIEGGESELFTNPDANDWLDRFPLVIIELHDWMLPGRAVSREFLRALSWRSFDVTLSGENLWCWNNKLLRGI